MVEVMYTAPAGPSYGKGTTWSSLRASATQTTEAEFAIEALIPTTKATGSGVGVIAQLVVDLITCCPTASSADLYSHRAGPHRVGHFSAASRAEQDWLSPA
jgi:hypothetical protein